MKISFGLSSLTAIAFVLAVLSTERAEAAQQTCTRLNTTEAVSAFGLNQNVNDQAFADVQGSTANFTVGGTANNCVIVSASVLGAVFSDAPAGQILSVIANLDGNVFSADGGDVTIQTPQFAFSGTGNFPESHSWSFIFPNVTPGPHTVKLRARVTFPNANQGGPEANISAYTMIITHR